MPDQHISNALHTHPPDPEFVASTRDVLRTAWNQPVQPAPSTERVPRSGGNGSGGEGPGHISRWIAGGAAAGLIVVAIGAVVVLGPRGARQSESTMPTVASTVSTALTPASQPVPATPPPVVTSVDTSPTDVTVSPPSSVTPAPTVSRVDPTEPPAQTTPQTAAPTQPPVAATKPTTTPPPTTTTTTSTTVPLTTATVPPPLYVLASVPAWALGQTSDPIVRFPLDGVYAAPQVNVDGATVGLPLSQIFLGEACLRQFPEDPKRCESGHAFEYDPENRVISTGDSTRVLAPFNAPDGSLVRYLIPMTEFSRLLAGGAPNPAGPDGITLLVDRFDFCKFRFIDGAITEIVYDETF